MIWVDNNEYSDIHIMYIYIHMYVYIYTYIHMYVYIYIYVYIYVRTYVRTYVCMYVCMYVYVYIYIWRTVSICQRNIPIQMTSACKYAVCTYIYSAYKTLINTMCLYCDHDSVWTIYIYIYTCMYIYIYMCIYIYMYINMYTIYYYNQLYTYITSCRLLQQSVTSATSKKWFSCGHGDNLTAEVRLQLQSSSLGELRRCHAWV